GITGHRPAEIAPLCEIETLRLKLSVGGVAVDTGSGDTDGAHLMTGKRRPYARQAHSALREALICVSREFPLIQPAAEQCQPVEFKHAKSADRDVDPGSHQCLEVAAPPSPSPIKLRGAKFKRQLAWPHGMPRECGEKGSAVAIVEQLLRQYVKRY